MPVQPICYSSPLWPAWLTAFVHTNSPPPSPPTLAPLVSSSTSFPASAPKHACVYFYFSWQCSPPVALSVCQGKAQYCGIEAEETPPRKSQPDAFLHFQISYFTPCSSLICFSQFWSSALLTFLPEESSDPVYSTCIHMFSNSLIQHLNSWMLNILLTFSRRKFSYSLSRWCWSFHQFHSISARFVLHCSALPLCFPL